MTAVTTPTTFRASLARRILHRTSRVVSPWIFKSLEGLARIPGSRTALRLLGARRVVVFPRQTGRIGTMLHTYFAYGVTSIARRTGAGRPLLSDVEFHVRGATFRMRLNRGEYTQCAYAVGALDGPLMDLIAEGG